MSDEQAAVYLAGAVANVPDNGRGWRNDITKIERYDWLNPLDKYDKTVDYDDMRAEWGDEDIVEADLDMLTEADALLVYWQDVQSTGTAMEIVYATMEDVPVVVVTDKNDLSLWLTVHADSIVGTFPEAFDALDAAIEETEKPMSRDEAAWQHHQKHKRAQYEDI